MEPWLDWAIELQSLAQAGLTYGKDVYDRERYQRIRDIAAEMLVQQADLPLEQVKGLFCNETGYQTPKLDTRAAIFDGSRILLVQEHDGRWSLPGGWVEVTLSIKENTIKEAKEESGYDVEPRTIIAVHDRNKHNSPRYAYGVCKIFVLCDCRGGGFVANSETVDAQFFALDELPQLAEEKNNYEQIALCFEAQQAETWTTVFD